MRSFRSLALLALVFEMVGCSSLRTGKVPLGTHGSRVVSRYQGTPLRIVSQPNQAGVTQYTVQSGDTLWGIANSHGVALGDLKRVNSIDQPKQLSVGQVLLVPGAVVVAGANNEASAKRRVGKKIKYTLSWPLKGVITTRFGKKHGRPHDGIDIAAARGEKIHSAGAGKVLYSDKHGGYGNLVVIQHDGGLVTVYAHNLKNLVKKGQQVRVGQNIALVGDSGKASGPHLHFEVRRGADPQNPMGFLPP
ncbi:MAG: LysM peptidoglycan-binding domain-containing M23 family metallopeptidase [Deltaproteobacteria bacterium]|jgi:lipoprotein NlpD|nr:LysM peptidoglycan-binding domain-containing M23 family metallopeptidase [Deltaproteobacteria bacterium]MBT6433071.1 LysM peptidoglycan-binding domain-containing M23 family metallopeptidase [Deltaproteobacteria bacterium]MBT6491393.1 LysM peptidoglycan-binding domain-containing M23 family metallopeptidase [Deltaproteobacteria bacterium]